MGGSRGGAKGPWPPQSANIIKGFGPHIDDCPTARQYVAPPQSKILDPPMDYRRISNLTL